MKTKLQTIQEAYSTEGIRFHLQFAPRKKSDSRSNLVRIPHDLFSWERGIVRGKMRTALRQARHKGLIPSSNALEKLISSFKDGL